MMTAENDLAPEVLEQVRWLGGKLRSLAELPTTIEVSRGGTRRLARPLAQLLFGVRWRDEASFQSIGEVVSAGNRFTRGRSR